MENKKRAIILDMDETLEHGIYQGEYGFTKNDAMMVLRPGIDELIYKLQEAKKQGIDIVLCTTACIPWVERLFDLKPEFKMLFDTRLTRDNQIYWMEYSERANPLEYEAKQKDFDLRYLKPVTTFGYDSVLFIDDNRTEGGRLKRLFEITQGRLEKDVTFFSGFGFNGGSVNLVQILGYKKAARQKIEIGQKLAQYLELEKGEPGCQMMCSVIDSFMSKEFAPGLTLVDEEYSEKYRLFQEKREELEEQLDELAWELEQQTGEELFGYSDSELAELKEYMRTDKRYPYEGIEVEQREENKREQFSRLLQVDLSKQDELKGLQKPEAKYQRKEEHEIE